MKTYKKIILVGFLSAIALIKLHAQTAEIKKYNLYKAKYDSLSKLPTSFHNDTLRLMFLDSIIESPPMVNKGIYHYPAYREIAYRLKWKKGIARYKMFYGNSIFDKKPVESVKMLVEAESELEKLQDYPSQIYALMRLSMALTHKTDSLSALSYINKAIAIAKKIKSQKWLLQTLNYKANTYVYRDRLDIAIPIFEEIDTFKNLDLRNKIINDLNLGMCYIYSNRVKDGMPYLKRTLATMPKDASTYISLHKQVRSDLINFHIDIQGDYKEAKKYFDELKQFQVNTGSPIAEKHNYYKNGYRIYKGLGDYKKALYFLEQRNIYNDSLNGEANKNGQEGIKSQLALKEQKEKLQKSELEKLKTENKRQTQFRWLFFILSIISLLSVVYILHTNKKLKNRNTKLLQKNKEISEALLKGQTIERRRMAMDLHDNLGSTLSALWYSLENVSQEDMKPEEKEIHQNIKNTLQQAYNEVRLLSHNLLPEEFEKIGLVNTLENLFKNLNKNSKIDFKLAIPANFKRIDHTIEFQLYSICLELLTNIKKHSMATQASIFLTEKDDHIFLEVHDNGIGFHLENSRGRGMKNIMERIKSIYGEIDINSINGTKIQIKVPINSQSNDA